MIPLGAVGLGPVVDWVKQEGGNLLTIFMIYKMVVSFNNEAWGKLAMYAVVGVLIFYFLGDIEHLKGSLDNIWGMIFK